jgi:hypothetical protein
MTAGYSATPLAKKLGITTGTSVATYDPPANLADLLDPLPDGVEIGATDAPDVVLCFATTAVELSAHFEHAVRRIRPDGAIWACWPKRAAKVPTDITEDTCRELFLPTGLVDVKVCAIDETWSGLKFVIRKELRPSRP